MRKMLFQFFLLSYFYWQLFIDVKASVEFRRLIAVFKWRRQAHTHKENKLLSSTENQTFIWKVYENYAAQWVWLFGASKLCQFGLILSSRINVEFLIEKFKLHIWCQISLSLSQSVSQHICVGKGQWRRKREIFIHFSREFHINRLFVLFIWHVRSNEMVDGLKKSSSKRTRNSCKEPKTLLIDDKNPQIRRNFFPPTLNGLMNLIAQNL